MIDGDTNSISSCSNGLMGMENIMPFWKASNHKSSDLQYHLSVVMTMCFASSGALTPLLPAPRTPYKIVINQRSNLLNLLNNLRVLPERIKPAGQLGSFFGCGENLKWRGIWNWFFGCGNWCGIWGGLINML